MQLVYGCIPKHNKSNANVKKELDKEKRVICWPVNVPTTKQPVGSQLGGETKSAPIPPRRFFFFFF